MRDLSEALAFVSIWGMFAYVMIRLLWETF